MEAFKYFKLDCRVTKSQVKVLIIFIAISLIFAVTNDSVNFAFAYLCFGSMMIFSAPFYMDVSNNGFYELLPGKSESKVLGRYLYLLALVLMTIFFGSIVLLLGKSSGKEIVNVDVFSMFSVLCIALIFGSIQYILYYKLGKFKSNYANSLFRMIPGVLILVFGSVFSEIIGDGSGVEKIIKYINDNLFFISLLEIVLTMIIFVVCITISTSIYKNKDL